MKVSILPLNYVIQHSVNQMSPNPSQSWSCITLTMEVEDLGTILFLLNSKRHSLALNSGSCYCIIQKQIIAILCPSSLCWSFLFAPHMHSCRLLSKMRQTPLIALSLAWHGLTCNQWLEALDFVCFSVVVCCLSWWDVEGPRHICIKTNT